MLGKVVEYVVVNVSVSGFGLILFITSAVMGLGQFEKKMGLGSSFPSVPALHRST